MSETQTREEFEHAYNGGDWKKTLESIRHGFASIECGCNYEHCTGWGFAPLSALTAWPDHYNTDAERAAALAHREELLKECDS